MSVGRTGLVPGTWPISKEIVGRERHGASGTQPFQGAGMGPGCGVGTGALTLRAESLGVLQPRMLCGDFQELGGSGHVDQAVTGSQGGGWEAGEMWMEVTVSILGMSCRCSQQDMLTEWNPGRSQEY